MTYSCRRYGLPFYRGRRDRLAIGILAAIAALYSAQSKCVAAHV